MQLQNHPLHTPEEYLALEEKAESKNEYIDGLIVPMTGGTTNHNQIAGNIYAELNFAFKRLDYRIYMGDVRLWIPEKRIYTYPDVMVIIDEPEYFNNRRDTIMNPTGIIEVLFASTEGYDREGKFQAYRTLPSFQEYLLVDQTQVLVEHYVKTAKKRWSMSEYDQDDEAIAFATIPCKITLADLYNNVLIDTA